MNYLTSFLAFFLLNHGLVNCQSPIWNVLTLSDNSDSIYSFPNPAMKINSLQDIIIGATSYDSLESHNFQIISINNEGTTNWVNTYNSNFNLSDNLLDLAIDKSDNIIITGTSFIDTLNSDIVTIKYDSQGNELWTHKFDHSGIYGDIAENVEIDEELNVYVLGSTARDTFYYRNLILLKINPWGELMWKFEYGDSIQSDYEGKELKLINDEIHVIGRKREGNDYNKAVMLKLSSDGVILNSEEQTIYGPMREYHIDNLGNYYIGVLLKYRLYKFNNEGKLQWEFIKPTNLPPNVTGDYISDIETDENNHIYLTGRHNGLNYGQQNDHKSDFLTIKMTQEMEILWENRYNNNERSTNENPTSLYLSKEKLLVGGGCKDIQTKYCIIKYDQNGELLDEIRCNAHNLI